MKITRVILAVILSTAFLFVSASFASGASWGPKTSTWNGTVKVTASGTMTRLAGSSKSSVKGIDSTSDVMPSYVYTDYTKLKEVCGAFGVSKVITGSVSACATTGSKTHYSSPEFTNTTVNKTFNKSWCDSNGKNCANGGYKTVAGACTQMAFPIPDSCTYAYVEFHKP